jgi:hypothetical protein
MLRAIGDTIRFAHDKDKDKDKGVRRRSGVAWAMGRELGNSQPMTMAIMMTDDIITNVP